MPRREPIITRQQWADLEAVHKKTLDAKQARIDAQVQENVRVQQQLGQIRADWQTAIQENHRLSNENQAWATAHAALERELETVRNKNSQQQAELVQLHALAPEKDPLLFLMRTKVNLLHQLALAQEKAGIYVTGRLLPDQSPRTLQEAAIYAAYEARAEYYRLHSHGTTSNVRWVHEGYRLDLKSEEAVREEQAWAVKLLSGELGAARSSAP